MRVEARFIFAPVWLCDTWGPNDVAKLGPFAKYWLPVLVWMGLIFGASSDSLSLQHSSRLIGPLVRWLFPHISERSLEATVFGIRKCAHMTEYAILACFLWRALSRPDWKAPRPWSWVHGLGAFGLTVLYAASDEFHQAFVPTRQASVWDVLIDALGAAIALGFVRWWVGRRASSTHHKPASIQP